MKDKIVCSKFLALIILLPMQIVFYGNKNGSTNLEELVRLLGTGTTLLTQKGIDFLLRRYSIYEDFWEVVNPVMNEKTVIMSEMQISYKIQFISKE